MSAAKVLEPLETVTGIETETETISPEEKLRRLEASNPGFKVYRIYNDEGNLITNPHILRSIAEGQEIIAEWRKQMERYEKED